MDLPLPHSLAKLRAMRVYTFQTAAAAVRQSDDDAHPSLGNHVKRRQLRNGPFVCYCAGNTLFWRQFEPRFGGACFPPVLQHFWLVLSSRFKDNSLTYLSISSVTQLNYPIFRFGNRHYT